MYFHCNKTLDFIILPRMHTYMAFGIILLTLSYTVCGSLLPKRDGVVWLHSPRITPWGTFGAKELCPMNSFVTGMRLKMDHQKQIGDNTALNAVQLLCTTLYGENIVNITSATGRFGNYGQIKYCPSGYAIGYQLRSQTGQGNVKDDVAAVNFKLICSNFNGTRSNIVDNELLSWGYWTKAQNCPSKTAVCGIVTQVEDLGNNVKNEDESTLNNVDIACCPVAKPFEICELSYHWETMIGCANESIDCEIEISTGIFENGQLWKFRKFYNKMGYAVEFDEYVVNALKVKAKKYVKKIRDNSLKHIISSETSINKEKSTFRVKCEDMIQQVVITCGFIKVYTSSSRCVPDEYAENSKGLSLYLSTSLLINEQIFRVGTKRSVLSTNFSF